MKKKLIHIPLYILFMLTTFLIPDTAYSVICTPPATSPPAVDYTAYPPFIVANVKPNLLMMIDNSASMYDLTYIDKGTATRQGYYCYDETYSTANTYAGYFDKDTLYSYNSSGYFETVASLGSCAGGETTKSILGTLLVCVNTSATPKTATKFVAKGNYLNWLSASKFDVEKKVLTGGKYDTASYNLIAESRGCVGRMFIKEAITADFQEFNPPAADPNTSLGITFTIRGPLFTWNETIPSQGGQTYLDIYYGDYNQALCQAAVDAYIAGHDPASIKKAVEDCLSATALPSAYCQLDLATTCTRNSDCVATGSPYHCTGSGGNKTCSDGGPHAGQSCNNDSTCNNTGPCVTPTATTKAKEQVVFAQSIQACWALKNGTPIGIDEVNTVENQCSDLYDENKICDGGSMDGKVCTGAPGDCPGGTCINGPSAIRQGNSSLLCSTAYAGYCASTANNWVTTTWIANGYASANDCIIAKHTAFCGEVQVPPVIDPSDDPSTTANYDNLPAIIGGVAVGSQLGDAIASYTVKAHNTAAPSGLIQEFKDYIRFGAMSFNSYGSPSECPANFPCTKICSGSGTVCGTSIDCPSLQTCNVATNLDGGQVIHHIVSYCSVTTSTSCKIDSDCLSGETCVTPVGDHSSGLIKTIDDITAKTWTPFAEGFYDAIGYFANRTDVRINTTDFDASKPPSQYNCQKNNVVLVTDGMSTADLNSNVNALVSSYNDGDGQINTTPAACPKFAGSRNLDDLAWLAKNKNIKNFTLSPTANSQTITTYVVFNGTASTDAGECNPETLMNDTATNGGGTYQRAENPDQLLTALRNVLLAISGATSSGTAVSVLATTGEGEGAIYQAYFYPSRKNLVTSEEIKWAGYLQGLFVDAYGNLREDTNLDDTLTFADDKALKMWYNDSNTPATYDSSLTDKSTYIDRFTDTAPADGKIECYDTNGDGRAKSAGECTIDSYANTIAFDNVNPIWEAGGKAGDLLFSRDPATRKIYTTINGSSFTTGLSDGGVKGTFYDTNKTTLRPYLRADTDATAANIINYIRGTDISGYRTRTFTINGTQKTWKLGDIIYSSPVAVGKPMENYDFKYGDSSYAEFKTVHQTRRGVVYVGANDGMLHAFNAGFYDKTNHKFEDTTGHSLGEELWAFVPKDLLPHLKWLTDPNYTHTYFVDLKPKIVEVKIFTGDATHKNGWGTILIGGMRFGGKDICCTDDFGSGSEDRTFRSAYFAIDITDPLNPSLLWTFTDANLGLTASYPAIVKISSDWYAVFGSGPTAYDGTSTLSGNVYVLKLNSGSNGVISLWDSSNYWKFPTGDSNAFMADAIAVDVNTDYTHDVVYIGETYKDGGVWKGKMFRLVTKSTTPSSWAPLSTLFNPVKPVTAAASAAKDAKGNLWVFFGTGRFLHTNDKTTTDQQAFYGIKDICKPWISTTGYECTTTVSAGALLDSTNAVVSVGGGTVTGVTVTGVTNWSTLLAAIDAVTNNGWYIDFSHTGERNYVKPLVLGGLVAWATYIPSSDICTPEGDSYVYAVYYETGTAYTQYVFVEEKKATTPPVNVGSVKSLGKGAPSSLVGMMTKEGTAKGFAQTSTGAIKEIEFETAMRAYGFKGWKGEGIK